MLDLRTWILPGSESFTPAWRILHNENLVGV
jgi:hypothetical protein